MPLQRKKFGSSNTSSLSGQLGTFLQLLFSEHSQEFDVVKIQSMKSRLQAWKGSFTKEKNISAMKKMEIERKTKITPNDINNFEASDAVRSIIKTLGKNDRK